MFGTVYFLSILLTVGCVKKHRSSMTAAESYRVKAAELTARAAAETDRAQRAELHALAQSYLRLAER